MIFHLCNAVVCSLVQFRNFCSLAAFYDIVL